MKTKPLLTVAILMICCLYSGLNLAHGRGGGRGGYGGGGYYGGGYRGHSSFGFYFGAPYYPYPYYGYPYRYPYYPPAVIAVPATPPVYIQQPPAAVDEQDTSGYWHFCANPEGYYPYIKECPGGWQLVEPTPPAPR